MLDQKIVDETHTASVEYARQQYHFDATKEAFIAGARWMEEYLKKKQAEKGSEDPFIAGARWMESDDESCAQRA